MIANGGRALTVEQAEAIDALAARRLKREPVARIFGHKEFWSLSLQIGPAVLVPRPETETVVEAALDAVARDAGPMAQLRILDIGTGSGALLLAPQAGFQHAQTLRHVHLPIRVRNREHTASALAQRAYAARGEHHSNRRGISDWEVQQRDVVDRSAFRRGQRLQISGAPLRLLGELDDFTRALVRTDHRQRRQQHRDRQQDGRRPFE